MQKAIDCPHWKEYQGLNGWVMFCSAAAYGRAFTPQEAAEIGCTAERRAECARLMNQTVGMEVVPKIVAEKAVSVKL